MDNYLQPLPVEPLFSEDPKLFAYQLPSRQERSSAIVGDMVKVFIRLENYRRPKPIWFVIEAIELFDDRQQFSGRIWQGYRDELRQMVNEIEFDISHIYRLPLKRQEKPNRLFDAEYRDKKIAN